LNSGRGREMKSESGESVEHEAFSRKLIVTAVFVGILLIWVAQLVLIWPDWTDTETQKIAVKIATTLIGLGGMISSVACMHSQILCAICLHAPFFRVNSFFRNLGNLYDFYSSLLVSQ